MTPVLAFAQPWALLALVPVALLVWWRARSTRRRPFLAVPAAGPLLALPRSPSVRLAWMPQVLGALALALAVVALARPQQRSSGSRDVSVEGIDIVVALDLSTSMKAADFKPKNRIYVAKEVLKEFVESRPSDRIGLVVFASEAFTQCPLTLDQQVLLGIVDQLKTGVIEDGTAIGNGIATAVNRLRESQAKSKVVILITDGDNNAGSISPLEAAHIAKDLGIRVNTVLVGKGGLVPYPVQDMFGRTVYQETEIPVNPDLLKEIARIGSGQFYLATDRESLRESLRDILDSMEKTRLFEAGAYARADELFWWFLWPALALVLGDTVLRTTRLRRFP